MTKEEYYALSNKAKFRAFTVSRVADGDMVAKVQGMLKKNLEEGGGLGDFLKQTDEQIAKGLGLAGKGGGYYWENVYRTNVQTAYNAGRAMGFETVKPLALELVGIGDSRQTAICNALTQPPVRLAYEDPFWQTHWPPFHFGCRTTIRAIYDEEELIDEPVSENIDIQEKPSKGFGEYPIEHGDDEGGTWWRELDSQVRRAKAYGVQGEIEKSYYSLISKFASKRKPIEIENAIENFSKKESVAIHEELKVLLGKTASEKNIIDIGEKIEKIADIEKRNVFSIINMYNPLSKNRKLNFTSDSDLLVQDSINDALKYFPDKWVDELESYLGDNAIKATINTRGLTRTKGKVIEIEIERINNGTEVHELCHIFEDIKKELLKAEKSFYNKRTRGNNLFKLNEIKGFYNYDDDELVREGNFFTPYAGKDYGNRGYEIFSCGLEEIIYNKSVKDIDNEYKSFIIGIITGL